MKDPLESLRNKDRMSLREAAHAACDVSMDGALTPLANGANSERMKVGEVLRARQGQSDQVRAMLRRLVAAVDDPLDRLPATIKRAQTRGERLQPGQIGYVLQSTSRSAHSAEVDPDDTTVSRADLKAWCDTQQLRPSIFYPFDKSESPALTEGKSLPEVTAADEWVSAELALANRAAREFWSTAERDSHGGHPTNDAVGKWLKGQDNNMSDEAIKRIATLIRPAWAATGRRSKQQ